MSVLTKAAERALGGGISGAVSMVLNIFLLMWLRTTVNYQMRHGGTILETMRLLYKEGGVARFYAGMWAALLQGPLSRFGDTAANTGVLALLEKTAVPMALQTALASAAASLWRIVITPLDTVKTTLQVAGVEGFDILRSRISESGVAVLWAGALGSTVATFVGNYPWWFTHNCLDVRLPPALTPRTKLLRRAFVGFCASITSDLVSNSMRVVKTYVQTSPVPLGYVEAVSQIVLRDGVAGLLWRGLVAKIICNGVSSILFSICWKMLMDRLAAKGKPTAAKKTRKKAA